MGRRSGSKLAAVAVAAACALAPVAVAAASASSLYYERTLMSVAGARCKLFGDDIVQALTASAAQARGAALRGGVPMPELKATAARARAKANAVSCAHADLKTAAERVKTAFAGWSKLTRMTYPGEAAPWIADRTAYRSARWRLSQSVRSEGGLATFGVAGDLDRSALLAVASFPAGAQPYAARLRLRDEAKSPLPWLGQARTRPLPPTSASLFVLAEARADAEKTLLSDPKGRGVAFRFPTRAADRLAELDPRERFAVEFLFPGDKVRTVVFEVGDFAAGRAFVSQRR